MGQELEIPSLLRNKTKVWVTHQFHFLYVMITQLNIKKWQSYHLTKLLNKITSKKPSSSKNRSYNATVKDRMYVQYKLKMRIMISITFKYD
jgi:hypothetical protein